MILQNTRVFEFYMSEFSFNEEQRAFLLKIVRDSCQASLDNKKWDSELWRVQAEALGLTSKCGGVFTTMKNDGNLRGCIGIFTPDEPLWQVVVSRGLSTLKDYRFTFDPIRSDEFRTKIHISISVLSPLVPIKDPLKEVVVGVHGIRVSKGMCSGTYLPQVATEQGWDVRTFCEHCASSKANIPGDVLNDPDISWSTYTAVVISE